MIIKKSSKYNPEGELWHEGRRVIISRVFGGVAFHGAVRFALVLGEEQFYQQTHYFILCEAQTSQQESISDIIDAARKMEAIFDVQRWFGRVDANVKEIIAISNRQGYNTGVRNFLVFDVPRIGEDIDEMIGTVHRLSRRSDKRLHFFGESMIPAEILSLPANKIRFDKYPRASALTSVIHGMLKYSAEKPYHEAQHSVENWY